MHPEKVIAAAIGAPGGWNIAPVTNWNDTYLPYPVGIGGLAELLGKEIMIEEFKRTPLFFFAGSEDMNDLYEFRYKLVTQVFGKEPPKRWLHTVDIYNSVGANSQFKLYEGVGHIMTDEMMRDAVDFFIKHSVGKNTL